jgi:hypothetical protein
MARESLRCGKRLLLGYPDAQIFSFDDGHIHEVEYAETSPMQIVRRFVNNREGFLEELLNETPSLFKEDDVI